MKFRIHRGATVIGGNCVEAQARGKSLLLDLGLPLEAGKPDQSLLPPVEGLLTGNNPDLLGVVISHPHSDHYGLLEVVHPSVPVYIGDDARKLLEMASAFTTGRPFAQPITSYRNRATFDVGPFRIGKIDLSQQPALVRVRVRAGIEREFAFVAAGVTVLGKMAVRVAEFTGRSFGKGVAEPFSSGINTSNSGVRSREPQGLRRSRNRAPTFHVCPVSLPC